MRLKVKVEGLRDLDKALGQLSQRMGAKVLREALKAAAAPMAADAESRAPSRPADAPRTKREGGEEIERPPGTLKVLTGYGTKLTRRQRKPRAERDSAEVYVGTRDRAGVLEEFGTADAPAQPFLTPAWEGGHGQALNTATEALRRNVDEATAKARKKAEAAARRAARQAARGGR